MGVDQSGASNEESNTSTQHQNTLCSHAAARTQAKCRRVVQHGAKATPSSHCPVHCIYPASVWTVTLPPDQTIPMRTSPSFLFRATLFTNACSSWLSSSAPIPTADEGSMSCLVLKTCDRALTVDASDESAMRSTRRSMWASVSSERDVKRPSQIVCGGARAG